MNREIKFRGKRLNNGEWIYGYFVKDGNGKSRIYLKPFDEATSNTWFYVDEKTVGQFTTLFDIKNKEIYDGDVDLNGYVVKFKYGAFVLEKGSSWFYLSDGDCMEIISNIYENPELLQP